MEGRNGQIKRQRQRLPQQDAPGQKLPPPQGPDKTLITLPLGRAQPRNQTGGRFIIELPQIRQINGCVGHQGRNTVRATCCLS